MYICLSINIELCIHEWDGILSKQLIDLDVRIHYATVVLILLKQHCQDPNAILLAQEISNLVFKKKFSIVKGLGMRPSSSLVTTASSSSSVEYIHRLENEIIELKEARTRDLEE